MKQFKEFQTSIREDKKVKISGITVEIKNTKKGFQTVIDGDVLDTYSSEKEAMKMAKEFIKQYKGN
jgi:hypothetical protein